MPSINNPHDKFFRASMQNKLVCDAFFQAFLPPDVRDALDFSSLNLQSNSYLDKELQETISDIVYHCKIAGDDAYIALLVEHQSSPDKWLPFRLYSYMLNLLNSILKNFPDNALPAVYGMVFYHGEQSPYPYSLNLHDCFDDPLGLMHRWFVDLPIRLIDVNQLDEEELRWQEWVGPMARALKHIRDKDVSELVLDILQRLGYITENNHIELDFVRALLHYLLYAGNIDDVDDFLTQSQERLSGPVLKGELMTVAEKLEQRGMEKGIERGIEQGVRQTALNLLREGVDIQFVVKVTGLSEAQIRELDPNSIKPS